LNIAYLRNCNADSNQILHSTKDHQLRFVGGLSKHTSNPKWWTATVWKNRKTTISQLRFDRLAQNSARWRTLAPRTGAAVKISKLQKSKMADVQKRPYLCKGVTVWHEIWHDDAHLPHDADAHRRLKFQTCRNPTRWTAAI